MKSPSLEDEVARLHARLDRIEKLLEVVASLAIRQKSRREQARKAGVSVRTLQRRERKLRAKLAVEGVR